jgi:hypothetical protein
LEVDGAIGQRGFRQRIDLSSVAGCMVMHLIMIALLADRCVMPTFCRGFAAVDGKSSERDGKIDASTAGSKAGTLSTSLSSFFSDNASSAKIGSLRLSFTFPC